VVRLSPRIHFESGASVFAVLCFLPMNGAGPSAPEPGDSRGVTTGGTMGSRALGSDIERHEVHGATHGCGSATTPGPASPAQQHHSLPPHVNQPHRPTDLRGPTTPSPPARWSARAPTPRRAVSVVLHSLQHKWPACSRSRPRSSARGPTTPHLLSSR